MPSPLLPSLLPWLALLAACQPPPRVALPAPEPRDVVTASPTPVGGSMQPLSPSAALSAELLDEPPPPEVVDAPVLSVSHPLDDLTEAQIRQRVRDDLASLGSMSLGRPNSGSLVNGMRMPDDDRWVVVDPGHAHGTEETIDNLKRVIARVSELHPETPQLHVGHISGKRGGPLSPHLSHQSGRDVDLGYYYLDGAKWYERASARNLDVARTWTLLRAIITETDVEFVLIDHSLHPLLRAEAERVGEDPAWLDDLFKGTRGERPALIRHVKGHATHMHVRFFSPVAQETARRCYAALVAEGKLEPPKYTIAHRAKKGDTLITLAKRYGTTVKAIQRANGLRSTKIFAKKTYQIPQTGPARASEARVSIPRRRLPPNRSAVATP